MAQGVCNKEFGTNLDICLLTKVCKELFKKLNRMIIKSNFFFNVLELIKQLIVILLSYHLPSMHGVSIAINQILNLLSFAVNAVVFIIEHRLKLAASAVVLLTIVSIP